MSDWLPRQIERRPWLAFVIAIAMMGGISAYDAVRVNRARAEVGVGTWWVALVVGVALAGVLATGSVWLLRRGPGCLTIAGVLLVWGLSFALTHPRHTGTALNRSWELVLVLVADLPILAGIAVGLVKAWQGDRLWHPAPAEPEPTPEEREELLTLAAELEPSSPPSWSDRIDAVRGRFAANIPMLFLLIAGSTLFIGLPVGLFSSQGLGNGLVIGAILGLSGYGLGVIGLTFASLVMMLVELVGWVVRRLGRLVRGDAPEAR
jgi:hypothetical protein